MEQRIDEHWRAIVDYSRVPIEEDLYIVGSFAQSVTVYSQQVRAINLVDALAGLGRLRQSSRVAVIGGGISGLTASAALASIGVPVTVFEKGGKTGLASVQITSHSRYLHPHVYDWPFKSIDRDDAKLHLLTWKAGLASKVAKDLVGQWEKISVPNVNIESEVEVLARGDHHWRVEIDAGEKEFDVVISCVGFGVEPPTGYGFPYWADLPIDYPDIHSKNWLVSGFGDGALTDVMRLCIRDFEHGNILGLVVKAIEAHGKLKDDAGQYRSVGEILCSRLGKSGGIGEALFEGLESEAIARALPLREHPITLNATPEEVFGTPKAPARSSVLNRLVTWMLVKAGKVKLVKERILKSHIIGNRGDYTVMCGDSKGLHIHEILFRHGPDSPFGKAESRHLPKWMDSKLERTVMSLSARWDRMYRQPAREPGNDPTLNRDHWSDDMFAPGRLSPDFRKHAGIVVYSRQVVGGDVVSFENNVAAVLRSPKVLSALSEVTGQKFGKELEPALLILEDSLNDGRALSRTIRALCDAPIAIFDATVELPSLMFLLGIRSVVRRGISVLFRVGTLDTAGWRRIAFSLRELRLVKVPNRTDKGFEEPVLLAIVEGLRQFSRHPFHYTDLPAFGLIRTLGGHQDDYSRRTGDDQVLVLCPFDDEYTRDNWPELERTLRVDPGQGEKDRARRVIDLQSPEFLGRRLFDAIRRDDECVADLTGNRSSVLFELGVRMVANEKGARVVRYTVGKSSEAVEQPIHAADLATIDGLLGTKPYRVRRTEQPRVEAALRGEWKGGTVSPGFFYRIARDSVNLNQEAGGRGIETVLLNVMEDVIGKDRLQDMTFPALYAEGNRAIGAQTRRFAFDAMLAYVMFTDRLPKRQNPQKRESVLLELERMVEDLDVDSADRSDLRSLVHQLKEEKSGGPVEPTFEGARINASIAKKRTRSIRIRLEDPQATSVERDDGFAYAIRLLDDAIGQLKNWLGDDSPHRNDAEREIGDCNGVKGGTYRDWNKHDAARDCYDEGLTSEERFKELGGRPNSYCLVQRLVSRILGNPDGFHRGEALEGLNVRQELETSAGIVHDQMKVRRRGDPWAQADFALLLQLLGDRADAIYGRGAASAAWEELDGMGQDRSVYESAARVVELILSKLRPYLNDSQLSVWLIRSRALRESALPPD